MHQGRLIASSVARSGTLHATTAYSWPCCLAVVGFTALQHWPRSVALLGSHVTVAVAVARNLNAVAAQCCPDCLESLRLVPPSALAGSIGSRVHSPHCAGVASCHAADIHASPVDALHTMIGVTGC